jgi:Phage derived protein Gp49-like (DUF891)
MVDEPTDFVEGGDWGQVRHAKRANGRMESKEWLDAQDEGVQSKFDHLFRRIAAIGKIFNETQFRPLESGIWEFKRDGNRLLCFQHGNCWRLTHHYSKGGSKKCPKREIQRAITIRSECLQSLRENKP